MGSQDGLLTFHFVVYFYKCGACLLACLLSLFSFFSFFPLEALTFCSQEVETAVKGLQVI